MNTGLSRRQVNDEFFWELFSDEDIQHWLDQFEEWIHPWCCYHPDKERLDKNAKKFESNISEYVKTPYDRACLYFSSGSASARANLITEPIREYIDLSYFYEKFGITPFEFEHCDANWIERMILVSNAENSYSQQNPFSLTKADGSVIRG